MLFTTQPDSPVAIVVGHPAMAFVAIINLCVSWVALKMVYNVFFHPLRKYPGPTLWAASRFPWCWYQYKGKVNHKLLDLHSQYGHVVRVAPTELSYTSDTAWKAIYGHKSQEMGKDPVFSLLTPNGVQNILTADRETHTRQRRLMSFAFSEKALREQEDILQGYVNQLIGQLASKCESGPLNMVAWYSFTAYDIIGDLALGEQFGNLDKGDYDPFLPSVKSISKELMFTQMLKYYGLIKLRPLFMPKAVAGARLQQMKRAMAMVQRRMSRETDRKDFLHYILAANGDKAMSREEIDVNLFSLPVAGSESTATVLSGATFFMLNRPVVYDRLVKEIRSSFKTDAEITMSTINDLEYLNAVLTETLRMYPPVAVTLPRRVPPAGDNIDGAYVPGGTTVGINHFTCYRDPKNFYRPNDFYPERWLPETRDRAPFDTDNKPSMQPFSYGPRGCLGKNLAHAEMRLIMCKLLWHFDVELINGENSWEIDQQIFGFWVKPPLMCRLTPVA